MTSGHVTHEAGKGGRTACNHDGDLARAPGTSTCGQVLCREIRERIRLKNRPSWRDVWLVMSTPAQEYAAKAYSALKASICPGGIGHEGNGASAEYCDGCIAMAIAAAYAAGQKR